MSRLAQDDIVEENTGGLHYCQLQPFDDDTLEEGTPEARELKDLHEQATALCHGFLGPFKVGYAVCRVVQFHVRNTRST